MALIFHGTEVDKVIYHGTELDYVYYHGQMVYEATIYVAKPTLSGSFVFDNSAKSPTVNGFDAAAMTQSGTTSATAAGTYTITFTLNEGYAWADGTTAPYSLTWTIAKRSIAIPSMTNTSYTWTVNTTYAPTISNVTAAYVTQSGTTSSTNAGSFTVTWALKYPASTTWTDGTSANKTGTWTVAKRSLTIPTLTGTSFAFVEGTTRSTTVNNFNSTYETQSGTTSTAAQGTHTITWALRYPANTQWSDGTTSNKTASWSITWVNGTSHYSNDIYNKGWGSSNLEFRTGTPTWNSDNFTMDSSTGQTVRPTTTFARGDTFHALVKWSSGTHSVSVLQIKSDWGVTTINSTSVGESYTEVSGANSGNVDSFKYMGIRNSNTSYKLVVQRIWKT